MRLALGREQGPLAHAIGLGFAGTAKGRDFDLAHTIAGHAFIVLHIDQLLAGHVAHVVVRHQSHGAAILAAAARVDKAAVDHIGLCIRIHRIAWHVGHRHGRAGSPVHHAPEHRAQILQHARGIATLLQVDIAGKARLGTATAIGHQLIAVGGNLVQRPLVEPGRRNPLAQAVAVVQHQVIKHPGRIVAVGRLESAIPHARIDARGGIIVSGHFDDATTHMEGPRGHGIEQAGIDLQADQGRHGVAQPGIDHLGQAVDHRGVADLVRGGIGREPAHAHHPAAGSHRQIDAMRAAILGRRFAAEGRVDHLHPGAAIGLQVNRILHRVAIDIARTGVYRAQAVHTEGHAHSRQIAVTDGPNPGRAELELHIHAGRGLRGWKSSNGVLPLRTRPEINLHPLKIHAAICVLQRRLVQVDALQAVDQAGDLTLAEQIEHTGIAGAVQAVGRFHGLACAAAALAFVAAQAPAALHWPRPRVHHIENGHCWSSAKMPALMAAEPMISSPYSSGTGLPWAEVLTGPLKL